MAEISDIHVLQYTDLQRGWATNMHVAYLNAKMLVDIWHARGLGTSLSNPTDTIPDTKGGNSPGTANDFSLIVSRMEEFIADLEANGKAKLNTIVKISYNNGIIQE